MCVRLSVCMYVTTSSTQTFRPILIKIGIYGFSLIIRGIFYFLHIMYESINNILSFFRAKAWLTACNRPDLLDKVDMLHKSCRVCDVHFPPWMIQKGKRHLLRKDAVPLKCIPSCDAVPSSSRSIAEMLQPNPSLLHQLLQPSISIIGDSPDDGKSAKQTSEAQTFRREKEKEKLLQINNTLQLANKALKKENQALRSKCDSLELKFQEKLDQSLSISAYVFYISWYQRVPPATSFA